ncbi:MULTISPECIES: TetR/AcrR family transcriptional regulator [Acinetobacter]|uniref:TetR/AcrR family transcriptional regulator n=1 Tax=Acinetobacter TaxID=469 RepID=UPI00124DC7A8|nr:MULTISPECIES: TetR/AcrR family transcriptional regulator [Acinetobacter]MCU4612073.1 TetR/AcrR family transcriptional regulator [Acinetobacter parvus]
MDKPTLIRSLLSIFREYGYEGASLSKISERTGLGKASLYHHFPNGKQQMAQDVLSYLEQWREDHIFIHLQSNTSPIERLEALTYSLKQVYENGHVACILAVLTLSEAHQTFLPQIQPVFTRLIESISVVLQDAGISEEQAFERAQDTVIRIQGSLILSRALQSPKPFLQLMDKLPKQLLS